MKTLLILALLTCETQGSYTHCWNERGETTETIWHYQNRDYVTPHYQERKQDEHK